MNRIILLFTLLFFCNSIFAQNTDIDILKSINQNRDRGLDNTFKTISNSVAPISIAVPVGVFCAGLIKKDSTIKNKGLVMGATLLVTTGITIGLKYAVNRTRPYVTYPFIDNASTEPDPSFPSGHTSESFATATSLSLAFPKWYIIAPSYLWACSVAYSRLDLGVHYPSDVLAGAIIGAGSSYLCYKANKWLHKRDRK
jgi:membrane-associated phospholipid phosphatase